MKLFLVCRGPKYGVERIRSNPSVVDERHLVINNHNRTTDGRSELQKATNQFLGAMVEDSFWREEYPTLKISERRGLGLKGGGHVIVEEGKNGIMGAFLYGQKLYRHGKNLVDSI